MASGPINSWEIDGETTEIVRDFIFLGSKITVDSDCSHEIKRPKEIKPVNPKRNQPWIFIGRTDAEVEAPILWSPDVKTWLIEKDPDASEDWKQKEKGTVEDEMVGWYHLLNGHEFEQAPGVGDAQGRLA